MYKTRVTDAELIEPLALRVDVHLSHVRVLQHVTMQRSVTQSSFKAVRLAHADRPDHKSFHHRSLTYVRWTRPLDTNLLASQLTI